jgi:phage shock protein C
MTCPYCQSEHQPGAVRCPACTSWIGERPPIREWTRARDGKLVAGVARGLSLRFAVPVAALRFAFLLSVLLGGWGLVVYLALWIAMPREPAWYLAARAPASPRPPTPASPTSPA